MKHEPVKKKKKTKTLNLKNSIKRQLIIKLLIHRIVTTQDFVSKAQEHRTNFLPWEETTMPSAFYYYEISPLYFQRLYFF